MRYRVIRPEGRGPDAAAVFADLPAVVLGRAIFAGELLYAQVMSISRLASHAQARHGVF